MSEHDYRMNGRRAMRRWMADAVGMTELGPAVTALREGRVPERIVALWIADDLFANRVLEEAARAGYPSLWAEFEELDTERRASIEEAVRRAVDEALAEYEG